MTERRNPTRNRYSTEGLERFLASKYLTNLNSLAVGSDNTEAGGIPALKRADVTKNISNLKVVSNDLPKSAIKALANDPSFAQLRQLTLERTRWGTAITPDQLKIYFKGANVTNLKAFRAMDTDLGVKAIEALVDTGEKISVRELAFDRINKKGLQLITDSPFFSPLRKLKIEQHLDAEQLIGLIESDVLTELETLQLNYSPSEEVARVVARSERFNCEDIEFEDYPDGRYSEWEECEKYEG